MINTGVALLGIIFFDTAGSAVSPHAYGQGFQAVLPYMIGIAAAVALLAQLLQRRPAPSKPAAR
ncbi:hypothetical protein ACIO1C_24670 [Streptomyces sp. NPDC087420]|uniref:hypothetical protein n=1 Tax=Streptomyces sp. NPDC087420 TaxID=3365785 RepID=UPI0038361967